MHKDSDLAIIVVCFDFIAKRRNNLTRAYPRKLMSIFFKLPLVVLQGRMILRNLILHVEFKQSEGYQVERI